MSAVALSEGTQRKSDGTNPLVRHDASWESVFAQLRSVPEEMMGTTTSSGLRKAWETCVFFSHFNTTSGIDLISDAWRTAEASGAAETRCTTVEFRAMTENEMSKRLSSIVLVAMEERTSLVCDTSRCRTAPEAH